MYVGLFQLSDLLGYLNALLFQFRLIGLTVLIHQRLEAVTQLLYPQLLLLGLHHLISPYDRHRLSAVARNRLQLEAKVLAHLGQTFPHVVETVCWFGKSEGCSQFDHFALHELPNLLSFLLCRPQRSVHFSQLFLQLFHFTQQRFFLLVAFSDLSSQVFSLFLEIIILSEEQSLQLLVVLLEGQLMRGGNELGGTGPIEGEAEGGRRGAVGSEEGVERVRGVRGGVLLFVGSAGHRMFYLQTDNIRCQSAYQQYTMSSTSPRSDKESNRSQPHDEAANALNNYIETLKEENLSLKLENERLRRQLTQGKVEVNSKDQQIVELNDLIRGQGAKIETLTVQMKKVEGLVKKLLKRESTRSSQAGSSPSVQSSSVGFTGTPQRYTGTSSYLPYSHKSTKAEYSDLNHYSSSSWMETSGISHSPVGVRKEDEVNRFRRQTLMQSKTMADVLRMENIIDKRTGA